METSTSIQLKTLMLALYLCFAALSFSHCDARRSMHLLKGGRGSIIKPTKKIQVSRNLDMDPQLDASNTQPYVSSPFSLAPYDSLPPIPLPEIAPPFCVYPPSTPQLSPPTGGGYTPSLPPPSSSSTPPLPFLSPPPSPGTVPGSPESIPSPIPNPPESIPSPIPNPNPPPEIFPSPPTSTVPSPPTFVPSPTGPVLSPPYYYEPTPPTFVPSPTGPTLSPPNYYEPSPPTFVPSPTGPALSPPYYYEPSPPSNVVPSPPGPFIFVPSPPVFQPPVVYPPPAVPPPPKRGPSSALWCVAKPTVPDPIIQEAMNYACGSGADCDSIQPNGSCFHPNTLLAHASYAFNSYWQRSKVAGGRCEFGGTAMLVTVDPSYDGCHFVYY